MKVSSQTSVRRVMLVAAFLSVPLAYWSRWSRYKRMAAYHERMFWKGPALTWADQPPPPVALFHFRKAEEYDRAALRPWLTVEPETPPGPPN